MIPPPWRRTAIPPYIFFPDTDLLEVRQGHKTEHIIYGLGFVLFGAVGVEPTITPTPRAYVTDTLCPVFYYFLLESVLMHLAQAFTLLPEGKITDCKFGYFLILVVGLNLPRSFFNFPAIIELLPQIAHCFDIII